VLREIEIDAKQAPAMAGASNPLTACPHCACTLPRDPVVREAYVFDIGVVRVTLVQRAAASCTARRASHPMCGSP
jgi:hypothetical protein